MLALSNIFGTSFGAAGDCLAASVAGLGVAACSSTWDTSQEWLIDVNQSGKIVSVKDASQCVVAKPDKSVSLGDCSAGTSWVLKTTGAPGIQLATDTTKCLSQPNGTTTLALEQCAGQYDPSQTEQQFQASSVPIATTSTVGIVEAVRIQHITCAASNQKCGGGGMADKSCCLPDWKCTADDGQGGKYFKQCCLNGKCN